MKTRRIYCQNNVAFPTIPLEHLVGVTLNNYCSWIKWRGTFLRTQHITEHRQYTKQTELHDTLHFGGVEHDIALRQISFLAIMDNCLVLLGSRHFHRSMSVSRYSNFVQELNNSLKVTRPSQLETSVTDSFTRKNYRSSSFQSHPPALKLKTLPV